MRRFSILLLTCCTTVFMRPQTPSLTDGYSLQTGTLNIVLANRSGVVIAADSRRSSDFPFDCHGKRQNFCDDSQKLFRTGTASAIVIAGFAAGGLQGVSGSPLNVEVASILRRRFGDAGFVDNRGDVGLVAYYVEQKFLQVLPGVAAVFDARDPHNLPNLLFVATVAGIEKGVPAVSQLCFVPQLNHVTEQVSLFDFVVRPNCLLTGQPGPILAEHFLHPVLIGCSQCTEVASQIASGAYATQDDAIRAYYTSLQKGDLDNFTIIQMEALAKAMLKEAALHSNKLGGETQLMVFPTQGTPSMSMPPLPKGISLVPDMLMKTACYYGPDSPGGVALPGQRLSLYFEAKDWGVAPISQYFLASVFEKVSVVLDNNYFVDDTFRSVTFKYFGSKKRSKEFGQPEFVLLRPHIEGKCVVEIPKGVSLRPGSTPKECKVSILDRVASRGSIGGAIEPKINGTVTKEADGSIAVRNTKPGSRSSLSLPFEPCPTKSM